MKKIKKQNKPIKIKMKSDIHLCFRTEMKFNPLTITTSFLYSNINKIKVALCFSTKDAFVFP